MANTVITNIAASFNTAVTSTGTLCVADTADLAEIFDIKLTKPSNKVAIIINNTAAAGTVTFSLAASTVFFAGTVALTSSVLQSTSKVIEVDTAKYLNDSGVLTLTVTPASGAKLKTGNIVTIQVIELK